MTGILSAVSFALSLLCVDLRFVSLLLILACGLLLYVELKKAPALSIYMTLPLTVMAFRYLLIRVGVLIEGRVFTVFGTFYHCVVFADTVLMWLTVMKKCKSEIKALFGLAALNAFLLIYEFIGVFSAFGYGFGDVAARLCNLAFYTVYFLNILAELGIITLADLKLDLPESVFGKNLTDLSRASIDGTLSWEGIRENINSDSINSAAEKLVPKKLRERFPNIPALGFTAAYVLTFVLAVTLITSVFGGHDLNGVYMNSSKPMFPFTRIHFSDDGTFTAYCDYHEYDNGPRSGTYSKTGNRYYLDIDSWSLGYDLIAEKQKDGSLKLSIDPDTNGFAWLGDYIYIYPQ